MPAAKVTQAMVARVLKGTEAAGRKVTALRVDPDGSIFVTFGDEATDNARKSNPWDEVLEK